MGGSQYDDDWVLPSADITLVLVGKLGCGKSATGNSILGQEVFASEYSHVSVTNTCQMGSTALKDGRTINVIDTPGKGYLFDVLAGSICYLFGRCEFEMPTFDLVSHVILTFLFLIMLLWLIDYHLPLKNSNYHSSLKM